MASRDANEMTSGLFYGLAATLLWGSYPLWYKPLAHIDPWQLLSWRIAFAELFLALLVLVTGRGKTLVTTIRNVSLRNVVTVAAVLGFWWFIYIYGILTNRVLQVALGYFISPLMSIAVSRLIFKEKMTTTQYVAVGFATVGVVLMALRSLTWTSVPWIALAIGFCFSFYGIFKKKVPGDPVVMQTLEIMSLLPFSACFLGWEYMHGQGHPFLIDSHADLLLVATGIITVLPLWWYSRAAKQLPMIGLGFLQFVPPSCNFLLAIFVYKEPMDGYKLMVFSLIWIGLLVFMLGAMVRSRETARAGKLQGT